MGSPVRSSAASSTHGVAAVCTGLQECQLEYGCTAVKDCGPVETLNTAENCKACAWRGAQAGLQGLVGQRSAREIVGDGWKKGILNATCNRS